MNRRIFELFPLLLVILSGAISLSAQSMSQDEFRNAMDPYLGSWNGEYRIFSQQDELLNSFRVERRYWWEQTIMMERVIYDFGDMKQTYFNRIVLSDGMPYSFVTETPESEKIRSALRGSNLKGTMIWTRVLPKGSLPVRISERITQKGDERFIDFWGDQEAINNKGESMFVRIEGYLTFLPGSRNLRRPEPEIEKPAPVVVPDEPEVQEMEPETPVVQPEPEVLEPVARQLLEPEPEEVTPEPEVAEPEPVSIEPEPEISPEPVYEEPEVVEEEPMLEPASEEVIEPEPPAVEQEPEAVANEPEMEVTEPEPEPEVVAPEQEMIESEIEPESTDPEPEMVSVAPEPEVVDSEMVTSEPEVLEEEPEIVPEPVVEEEPAAVEIETAEESELQEIDEPEPEVEPERQEIVMPDLNEEPEEEPLPEVEETMPEPAVEEVAPPPPPPPMPNPVIRAALDGLNIVGIRDKKGEECIVVDYMLLYRLGDRLDMDIACFFTGIDDTTLYFTDSNNIEYRLSRKDRQ